MGNESSCISETSKHLLVPSNLLQVQRLEGPAIPNLHFWDQELSRIAFDIKTMYDFSLAEIQDLHRESGLPVVNEKDIQRHCHEYARQELLETYFHHYWQEEQMKFPEAPTRLQSNKRPQLYDVYEMSVRHKEWLLRQKTEATCQKEYLRANFGRS